MENKQKKNETYNIKLNLLQEKIDIQISSDYKDFITNICNILLISHEQFNSLLLSYIDEDGDSTILSNEEDYMIFIQQIKKKLVNNLYLEFTIDSKIDQNLCLGYALDYQEQIEKVNNNVIKNNNKINNNFNDNYINDNMNNNKINYDNNNYILNKEPNNNTPVDDKLFFFNCHYCDVFPIVCTLYYCDKCQIYICEDCWKKKKHEHEVQKLESNYELMKLKDKEIEKKNQIKNNQNNNQLNHKYNNNNYRNNDLNNNNYRNNDLNNNNYRNNDLNNNNYRINDLYNNNYRNNDLYNNNYRNNDLNNNNYRINDLNNNNYRINDLNNNNYRINDLYNNNFRNNDLNNDHNSGIIFRDIEIKNFKLNLSDVLNDHLEILKKYFEEDIKENIEDFNDFKDMVKNQLKLKFNNVDLFYAFIKEGGNKDKALAYLMNIKK